MFNDPCIMFFEWLSYRVVGKRKSREKERERERERERKKTESLKGTTMPLYFILFDKTVCFSDYNVDWT